MLAGLLVTSAAVIVRDCCRCAVMTVVVSVHDEGWTLCHVCKNDIASMARYRDDFPDLVWNELVRMPNPCIELGSD